MAIHKHISPHAFRDEGVRLAAVSPVGREESILVGATVIEVVSGKVFDRSTCRSRRRRPHRVPAPLFFSRRWTAPMVRSRPRRTSWTSKGGRRVPPTSRSLIWPARRGRRRRPCLRADGRHHLRRRRSIESSRCCLLYLGRRRRHRLPGVRRHRLRRRRVLARRLHRRLSSWRRVWRRGWCKSSFVVRGAREQIFFQFLLLWPWYLVRRVQWRPYIALYTGKSADCKLAHKFIRPWSSAPKSRRSHTKRRNSVHTTPHVA